MTDMIGVPSCEKKAMLAATYGAVTRFTGLDLLLVGFGAPSGLHWALAGGVADIQCKHQWKVSMKALDQDLALCMAAGFGGGYLTSMIMR